MGKSQKTSGARSTANPAPIDIATELTRGLMVHSNVRVEVLMVSTDKLRISLGSSRACSASLTGWVAPLGILITVLATLVSADFRDCGLSKDAWRFLFTSSGGAVGLWLVLELRKVWRTFRLSGLTDPEEAFVSMLKKDAQVIYLDPARQMPAVAQVPDIANSALAYPATSQTNQS